tara:strand:- start:9 stop:401 length:393 start_codon:yes stop_codon:yes gene_type:complete
MEIINFNYNKPLFIGRAASDETTEGVLEVSKVGAGEATNTALKVFKLAPEVMGVRSWKREKVGADLNTTSALTAEFGANNLAVASISYIFDPRKIAGLEIGADYLLEFSGDYLDKTIKAQLITRIFDFVG